MRLFLASTLSLFCPDHALLDADRELWLEIARRTFKSGTYRAVDEIDAHADLTRATVKDSYLVINGRYQLNILGSLPGTMPQAIERSLLDWLLSKPDGIGYLGIPLKATPPNRSSHLDRWLASHEALARLFPAWKEYSVGAVEWIWEQRDADGYWDFGPRPRTIAKMPYSTSWRKHQDRKFDWTTRILILLRRYYGK